jgi:predicted CXXCH cytochrome family protein
MLNAVVPSICSNCHPNEAALTERAVTKHNPMMDRKMCLNCHDPHFTDFPRLLPKKQVDLCLGCHDKELETESGRIMNMKTSLDENKNGHGPVKNGDCVTCHNPHGSDYWRLLVRYYPAEFYTGFSDGKYALCFSCHEKAAFSDVNTTTKTGFRDGKRNLHFLHVNKNPKGRTCRACHEVHADAGAPNHVRESVGFKGWTMPLNFTRSKEGGTCAPGCHGEKRYTR